MQAATTFDTDTPAIGQPDDFGILATRCNNLVEESRLVRDGWLDDLDKSLNLYLHGRAGGPDASRTTVNKIQAIVHTFVDLAVKQPPVVSWEIASVGDLPEWYLLDPVEGLDIAQPIPPEMLTQNGPDGLPMIPEAARVAVDNELVADFIQDVFDILWERARANQFLRENVWLTNLFGWTFGLYEWDDEAKSHILSNPPIKQFFPDTTVADIKDMAYLAFDWPMDEHLARKKYPKLEEQISQSASTYVRQAAGSTAYSSVFTEPTYRRKIVTVRTEWLRNERCPVPREQALAQGQVKTVQLPAAAAGGAMSDQPGMMSRAVDAFKGLIGLGPEVPEENAEMPAMPAMREAMVHAESGEEIDEKHPQWPTYVCIRKVVLIGDVVAEDKVSETWDFPFVHNVNIPVPNRPFGQGEPIRVESLQTALNSLQDAGTKHAQWFKGPAGVGDAAVRDLLPEGFKDAHMNPETIWWIDSLVMKETGGKPIQYYDPPELPPAVVTMKRDIESALDIVSNVTPVMQGDAPSQWSGVAMENQQAASTNAASFKSLRFEEVVWRLSKLMHHSILTRMGVDDFMALSREYPVHVVAAIVRRAQGALWECKVEGGSGAGQAKAQKEGRVLNFLKMGIVDLETARDMLGLDHKLIEQRIKAQQQSAAQTAAAAAPMQPQAPMQPAP